MKPTNFLVTLSLTSFSSALSQDNNEIEATGQQRDLDKNENMVIHGRAYCEEKHYYADVQKKLL